MTSILGATRLVSGDQLRDLLGDGHVVLRIFEVEEDVGAFLVFQPSTYHLPTEFQRRFYFHAVG